MKTMKLSRISFNVHINLKKSGIYAVDSKPSDLEAFLNPFVTELIEFTSSIKHTNKFTGIETIVLVRVRVFICDSPARALIKGVVNFNAKHGYLKCTVVDEYSQVSRTVTYLRSDCPEKGPERNDGYFRSKKRGKIINYIPLF